jgi:hypothetical protein
MDGRGIMLLVMNTIDIQKFKEDYYHYFSLCVYVSGSRGKDEQAIACRHLRDVMIALGYPYESKFWDDQQTLMYADNIVMMG